MHTLKVIAKHTTAWLLWALVTNINTIWYGYPAGLPWLFNHLSLIALFYLVVAVAFPVYYRQKNLIFVLIPCVLTMSAYIYGAWLLDQYWTYSELLPDYKPRFLDYAEGRFARALPYAIVGWYYATKKAALQRSSILLKTEQSIKVVAMTEALNNKKNYEARILQLESLVDKALEK